MPARAAAALVLTVGLAGAATALHGHGGAELLRVEESRSLRLAPATTLITERVQELVARAPEPVAAPKRTPVRLIRCSAGGAGPLRNPWNCELRYRSGTTAHYTVTVQPDGSYTGRGTGRIDGCCIKTPMRE